MGKHGNYGADGPKAEALMAELAEEPYAYDFFAALRSLQSRCPGLPRIGCSRLAAEDPVRFAQSPALDFAPATLEAVQRQGPTRPPVLYCRHFGLFGPNGPLPLCLTEYARDRILHHRDPTFAAFCNIFHHRLLSFFFRAWADAQKTVDLDRPDDQHWARFIASLVGLGMESFLGRDGVPDRAKWYFAGRLVHQPRNTEGLEAIIGDFFGLPTQVLTFVGRWLNLPPESCCRLGQARESGSLGRTLIVGARYWTSQLHFRLRLGPMSLADYERMLPYGRSFGRVTDWVRLYAAEHYSWDLQLVLVRAEVPAVQLGKAGRLGWTSWLKTQPFEQDADDLKLQGAAVNPPAFNPQPAAPYG